MKIKCLTKFLDGKDTFEQDDERTVSDERGMDFVDNGWAEDTSGVYVAGSKQNGNTDLTINNSGFGLGDSNG